jgi:hypothetical protein
MCAETDNAIEARGDPARSAAGVSASPTCEYPFRGTEAKTGRNVYSQTRTNRNRRKSPRINYIKISTRKEMQLSQSSSLTFVTFRAWPAPKQIDRHACRTKIAVSPAPSAKAPELIDTLFTTYGAPNFPELTREAYPDGNTRELSSSWANCVLLGWPA